jgi:hypothetical protein
MCYRLCSIQGPFLIASNPRARRSSQEGIICIICGLWILGANGSPRRLGTRSVFGIYLRPLSRSYLFYDTRPSSLLLITRISTRLHPSVVCVCVALILNLDNGRCLAGTRSVTPTEKQGHIQPRVLYPTGGHLGSCGTVVHLKAISRC